ncbi:MAG: diaminopimelate decarboxylase [Bacteroidota bacterium]
MISTTQLPLIQSRPTPFYAYNLALLKETVEACRSNAAKHGYHVHYALKANSNPAILRILAGAGFGADCVSGNEVLFALENNFAASKTVFAGVGKSDEEIEQALDANIRCFNCESIEELRVINEIAGRLGKTANVALRINPNVNANTHHYITTGLDENKFGINRQQLPQIVEEMKQWNAVKIIGIHFHIGSQITDLDVFKNLCQRVNEFTRWFAEQRIHLEIINVGGGLGIDYTHPERNQVPDFEAYFDVFRKFLEVASFQEVHFELGRALVAQCGDLISRVLYVKQALKTKFVILDAGMTELLRPALYQAKHKLVNLSQSGGEQQLYDVVGPVCESSDSFSKAISLPETSRGDLFAIRSAGAYGEVMASHYNLRKLKESFFY